MLSLSLSLYFLLSLSQEEQVWIGLRDEAIVPFFKQERIKTREIESGVFIFINE